jgi:Colicin M
LKKNNTTFLPEYHLAAKGAVDKSTDKFRRTILFGGLAGAVTSIFPAARVFATEPVDFGTLPPIKVYANPPKGDVYYGLGGGVNGPPSPPPGSPPMNPGLVATNVIANGKNVFSAAVAGNPLAVLDAFFQGLSARSAAYVFGQIQAVGLFSHWMSTTGYQELVGSNQFGFLPTQTQHTATMFGLFYTQARNKIPIQQFQFYGTALMVIAAIYYWIAGDGQARSMNMQSLGLTMTIDDFQPVKDIIKNPAMGPGTYPISAAFSTNLFNHAPTNLWAAGVLGRVGGQVDGTLVMDASNNYSFTGQFILSSDKFDADPSHRPFPQESLTTFLREIGSLFDAKDYTINFVGSQPISLSGSR